MKGQSGESLLSPERTFKHSLGVQCYIKRNLNISLTLCFGQIRQTWFVTVYYAVSYLVKNLSYHHKHLLPNVKHGGVLVMGWVYFATIGPWHIKLIQMTMNSLLYQSILEANVRASVQQLKLI